VIASEAACRRSRAEGLHHLDRVSLPTSASRPAALVASLTPASADLRVCNNTKALINFAVGVNAGADFSTEGWWTVTPGSCATPIKGPLTARFVYLYATDIDAADG